MASQEITEMVTVAWNPSLQPSPSEPPAAFTAVATQLKATTGVNGVYLGRQIEHPDLWTWIVRWDSQAAYDGFVSSEGFGPLIQSFLALLIDPASPEAQALPPRQPPTNIRFTGGTVDTALDAPVTEVFSCYAVDDGFLDANLKTFAQALDSAGIPSYHGYAFGSFHYEAPDQPKGEATRLLIGWDSKEAHLAQKGEGKPLEDIIHHVRSGRQAADMFHVPLTRI
jgi:quinol monooxygenase YgiN